MDLDVKNFPHAAWAHRNGFRSYRVHGVSSVLLRAQVSRVLHAHFVIQQQRATLVPVVVTSSQDVAAAVRRAGGGVEGCATQPLTMIASIPKRSARTGSTW